jgi:hypothetical protein
MYKVPRDILSSGAAPLKGGYFYSKTYGGTLLMAFFQSAVTTLQTLVIALGAGLAVWGVINLLEEYGSDNPAANAQAPQRSNCLTPQQ